MAVLTLTAWNNSSTNITLKSKSSYTEQALYRLAFLINRGTNYGEGKMNKREFAKLKKWTDTLTDEELKKEYYDTAFKTLGSQAEEMYERGYDPADIREREKYERWLSRQSDMLEVICRERGITLWEEFAKEAGK